MGIDLTIIIKTPKGEVGLPFPYHISSFVQTKLMVAAGKDEVADVLIKYFKTWYNPEFGEELAAMIEKLASHPDVEFVWS